MNLKDIKVGKIYQGNGMNRRVILISHGAEFKGAIEYMDQKDGKDLGLSHFVWEENFVKWAQKEI